MRIVVTGATGFVGRPLLRKLIADGHEVIAWTREQRGSSSEIWQSVPRPMRVSRAASRGKFVPECLPVRIVR